MTKKIFIDFKQIKNDIKILANEIIHSKFNYQAIIAITGGGLVPARLLRNYLNIPIFCVNIKYYDKNDKAHLVEEKPGALMDMHIATPHEVTPIGEDEQPKYSLALCWFPSSAGVA